MTRLVWVDRNGRAEGSVVEESGLYRNPALSPDGSRLAIERVDAIRGTSDIWLIDVAQKTMQRLTFDGASEVHPAWFPDGKRIYFASNRQKGSFDAHDGHRINPRGLYSVATDGPGAENLVLESNNDGLRPAQVSPDRRYLLYEKAAGLTITLNVLPLAEKGSSALDLDLGNLAGSRAQISPDGRWIAYVSVESGRNEVLIEGFANKRLKRQISIDGGVDPRWRGDGKELFYYSSSGALMAVPITSDETLTVGRAVPLFSPDLVNGPHSSLDVYLGRAQYDVSRDGQRFLLNVPAHAQDFERPSPSVTVMLNWMRE